MHLAYRMIEENGFDEVYKNLTQLVDTGYIKTQACGNFELFDYTRTTQFERFWNDYTLMSRGLILDVAKKKIAAMPFPKFFNYGEDTYDIPEGSMTITEKMDGSMGTIFWDEYNNEWQVATRGSFKSDQAIWAKDYLYTYMNVSEMRTDLTYIVEIIYPENRIVVNYGDKKSLTLLAIFNNDTGQEMFVTAPVAKLVGFDIPKSYTFDSIKDSIEEIKTWDSNQEGVVVRFENDYRVKIKSDEYCRVHKIISDVSPLSVWESMMELDDLELIKKELPEEFWSEFDGYVDCFQNNFDTYINRVNEIIEETKNLTDKEIGLLLQSDKEDNRRFYHKVFLSRKGKFTPEKVGNIRRNIYKEFKPKNNNIRNWY